MKLIVNDSYTYQNSICLWLISIKEENDRNNEIIEIKDRHNNIHKCSVQYLWTLGTDERKFILEQVLNYYINNGFPYELYNDDKLISVYNKLKDKDENDVLVDNNIISNFGLVIKESYKKYDLTDDMTRYLDLDLKYKLVDTYRMLTSQLHLSSKVKTGNKQKKTDKR